MHSIRMRTAAAVAAARCQYLVVCLLGDLPASGYVCLLGGCLPTRGVCAYWRWGCAYFLGRGGGCLLVGVPTSRLLGVYLTHHSLGWTMGKTTPPGCTTPLLEWTTHAHTPFLGQTKGTPQERPWDRQTHVKTLPFLAVGNKNSNCLTFVLTT